MPRPRKGPRLGGDPHHQRQLMANLAIGLFEHGGITTTVSRAKALRPYAEKLITKAKKAHLGENPLHNRREVLKTIRDKSVVHTLFTEIAPTFAERPGGYTRITKIGPRQGDNAPMAVIEIVTEAYKPAAAKPKAKKTSDKPAKPATAVEEPPTELAEEASPEGSVVADEAAEIEATEPDVEATEPEVEATEPEVEETVAEPESDKDSDA